MARAGVVREVKKSAKLEHVHVAQVKYYLYALELRGVRDATGLIEYPTQRKTTAVELTAEDRRDIAGYARALEWLDGELGRMVEGLAAGDLLVITADHGNDPSWAGWNHTREYVPVLACGPAIPAGTIGRRDTFADIGQSLAAWFGLPALDNGTSFLQPAAPSRAQRSVA